MPGRQHMTRARVRVRTLGHPSAVLFACLFASQSALLVLSPILVDVAREFGVSAAAAGQLRSISGATGGVAALVVATAPRRPGLRALLSLGTALVVAGSLLGAVAEHGWRWAFVAVPAVAGLVALALVRLRPTEVSSRRTGQAVSAWRRPDVARFAFGELLANAAWAAVLTYSGALLRESYSISSTIVAISLGLMAAAMLPGAF